MNILFLSHTAAGGDFVVGSHHLSREMAILGHNVAHISAPVSLGHIANLRDSETRRRFGLAGSFGDFRENVLNIVPFSILPWKLVRKCRILRDLLFTPYIYVWLSLKIRKFEKVDLIFLDEPRLLGLIRLFPNSKLVYRPTDVYSKMTGDHAIDDLERTIVRNKTFELFATSYPVSVHLKKLGASAVSIVQNGGEFKHFSNRMSLPKDLRLPPGFRAIYAGAFDKRFSIEFVLKAAAEMPSVNFVLVGPPDPQMQRQTKMFPNIHWLGAIKYAELPGVLQACDLGLLPLSNHPANQGRSPMKLYEYAACGIPVVSTWTEELSARSHSFVHLCKSETEFAVTIKSLLSNEKDRAIERREIESIAEENSWEGIAKKVLSITAKN